MKVTTEGLRKKTYQPNKETEGLRKKTYQPNKEKEIKASLSCTEVIEVFRRMCLTRYFELEAIEAQKQGYINCLLYLSIGQESISATVATIIKDYYIFAQHRAHSVYLAFGGNPMSLIDELLGLKTGCNRGIGGSPCIQSDEIKMVGHHGLIGENVPLAVGMALGTGEPVVCFFGDAAAEEDYVFASMGFAQTHKLPVLFVCEDNNLSILTAKSVRRNWELSDVVKGLGMPSADVFDNPWLIAYNTKRFIKELPAFLNCRTCRQHWHVGIGIDGEPEWDRFKMMRGELKEMGLGSEIIATEYSTKRYMEELWKARLLMKSGK